MIYVHGTFAGNDVPEIIRGRRSYQLMYRGYSYTRLRQTENYVVWECTNRKCRVVLKTTVEITVTEFREHKFHAPDQQVCEAKRVKAALVDSILHNPNQPTVSVCREALLQTERNVAAYLQVTRNLARNLRYHRAKLRPSLPRTAEELAIPNYLSVTKSGERFLLKRYADENDCIYIFASDYSLQCMCLADTLCCDGTFDCVPSIFTQLFTVNYFYAEKLLPAIYVLSRRRTAQTYELVLAELKEYLSGNGNNLKASKIICDYENSLLATLQAAFPRTKIQGCYFHFCQCVYRKVQKLGLSQLYLKSVNFKMLVRVLMALAFLPSGEITDSFDSLERCFANWNGNVDKLFHYIRKRWIGCADIWNVHGERIRTNNDIEAWHAYISRYVR